RHRAASQAAEGAGDQLHRLITNADIDYYVSFDNLRVGQLQAQTLVKKLRSGGPTGSIIMINGAPTDNNAKLFKQGALSVLNTSGFKIAKQYDTRTGARTRPRTRCSRRSPRWATTASSASTRPTTGRPGARSRR